MPGESIANQSNDGKGIHRPIHERGRHHRSRPPNFLEDGEATYAEFARKLGITPSTLFRLEQSQQSVTLRALEPLLARLKCKLEDVFPDHFRRP